ncbi:Phosphate regulon transcriptional regulatory protein PhoB [Candidatus Brocadiaceae bacterium B188]|jgi:DNA-binding NtrC family response regulator|nr:response regulator [Candidatus Brocadia sapporoensis]OQZ03955.1 MAG: hypothetical protein B6D34_04995 [Candidatus Brocadia sp. UTAMX1]QQR66818.1 MAG: response regulator [Candidatus Brocadia sp.]RZV57901.1 MAG: response regulator [Candidatus Brocadia sp. BROELEC01]TWU53794.1 Phosphate regulon transcriptional regulatory protein PhoB [Candidatus Brocadiaceae bacterium B188]
MSRILIIGDRKTVRRSLVNILKQDGFGICEGVGWDGAVRSCKKKVYDLIMMDLDSESQNNYEILKEIKHVNSDAEIVAIVSQNRYDANRMNSSGVYDYLQKPFRQKEVIDIVKKALEKKQLTDKVRNLEQIMDVDKFAL